MEQLQNNTLYGTIRNQINNNFKECDNRISTSAGLHISGNKIYFNKADFDHVYNNVGKYNIKLKIDDAHEYNVVTVVSGTVDTTTVYSGETTNSDNKCTLIAFDSDGAHLIYVSNETTPIGVGEGVVMIRDYYNAEIKHFGPLAYYVIPINGIGSTTLTEEQNNELEDAINSGKLLLLKGTSANSLRIPFNYSVTNLNVELDYIIGLDSPYIQYNSCVINRNKDSNADTYTVTVTQHSINLGNYQTKTDNNLETENKTIVGAINEINSKGGSSGVNKFQVGSEQELTSLQASTGDIAVINSSVSKINVESIEPSSYDVDEIRNLGIKSYNRFDKSLNRVYMGLRYDYSNYNLAYTDDLKIIHVTNIPCQNYLAADNGYVWAKGESDDVVSLYNGSTLEKIGDTNLTTIQCAYKINNKFIATGELDGDYNTTLLESTDGLTWAHHSTYGAKAVNVLLKGVDIFYFLYYNYTNNTLYSMTLDGVISELGMVRPTDDSVVYDLAFDGTYVYILYTDFSASMDKVEIIKLSDGSKTYFETGVVSKAGLAQYEDKIIVDAGDKLYRAHGNEFQEIYSQSGVHLSTPIIANNDIVSQNYEASGSIQDEFYILKNLLSNEPSSAYILIGDASESTDWYKITQ